MPQVETEAPQKNLFEQTQDEFPVLKNQDIGYKESFGRSKAFLETWPPNEPGDEAMPRPKELAADKYGIEVYNPKTTTMDILGDVVSHKLINDDEKVKGHYEGFVGSLQPWQKKILKQQYERAKENQGEERPYEAWEKNSGLPAYFRGHPFKQWGDDAKDFYTPSQIKKLDKMMDYLRGKKDDDEEEEAEPSKGSVLYDHPRSKAH